MVLLKTRTRYAFTKLPETVVYQGQVDNGEVLPKRSYKETRILLIYTVAFFFFNKVAGLRPAALSKRDSGTGVFL